MPLALFDLDHTLIDGDSDVLWCSFLLDEGVLDRAVFEPRNAALQAQYQAGTVSVLDFCAFYVSTLSGRTPAQWQPLQQRFLAERVRPRIPAASRALLQAHRDAGDTLVLTTATNRFLTELTAADLGVEQLLATECGTDAEGRFDGRVVGTPNMRDGKVERLQQWLAGRGLDADAADAELRQAAFYSDSMNDLPLLRVVGRPVAVNADERLAALARDRGWAQLTLKL